jgi:hypothetical protein
MIERSCGWLQESGVAADVDGVNAKRAKTLVVALAAACVLVGCGGSAGSSSAAGALGYSHAVNLQPGDVPGAIVRPYEASGQAGPFFDAWTERCDGGLTIMGSGGIVGYSSPRFTRGVSPAQPGGALEGVRSDVFVLGSEAAAKRELAVLASARARACVRRDDGETNRPGSETHLQVSSLSPSLVLGAYGMRWSAVPSFYRPPRRRYQDRLAFVVGRALIVLYATSTAAPNYTAHPVPAALEQRLLMLLYSRGQANEL